MLLWCSTQCGNHSLHTKYVLYIMWEVSAHRVEVRNEICHIIYIDIHSIYIIQTDVVDSEYWKGWRNDTELRRTYC